MSSPAPVTARQIADLLAWARDLAEQGPTADPSEQAAFLAAKQQLLDRLTDDQHDTGRRS